MGKRREARRWAMQMLFQLELNRKDPAVAFREFWANTKAKSDSSEFVESLVLGTIEHMDAIDAAIGKYAQHWDIKRMGRVDRSIIRIALYEMMYRDDIPPVVSINEAVEIAKEFGDVGSGKFVNGLLDGIRKDLGRPAREAHSKARKAGARE